MTDFSARRELQDSAIIWQKHQAALAEIQQGVRERVNREILHADLCPANSAREFCRRLVEYIVDFEKGLDATEEVGLSLVSFGQTVTFHVTDLGYSGPSLVHFSGTDDDRPVRLVQHVSQISFLLIAVKRPNPDEPRKEMGYHTLYRKYQDEKPESVEATGDS